MCAEHLHAHRPVIHSVDISQDALDICKVVTADFSDIVHYHRATSEDFLRTPVMDAEVWAS